MSTLQRSRITDIGYGICSAHESAIAFTTTIQTGASTVLVNGLGSAIIGSIGFASCGHTTTALVGSSTVFAEGIGVHRLTDMGTIAGGTYTMQTSSSDVAAGG